MQIDLNQEINGENQDQKNNILNISFFNFIMLNLSI